MDPFDFHHSLLSTDWDNVTLQRHKGRTLRTYHSVHTYSCSATVIKVVTGLSCLQLRYRKLPITPLLRWDRPVSTGNVTNWSTHRPITHRSFKPLVNTFISFCEHTHHHAYNNFSNFTGPNHQTNSRLHSNDEIDYTLLVPKASSDCIFELALGICQQPWPRLYHPIESSACKSEHYSFIQINTISVCQYIHLKIVSI